MIASCSPVVPHGVSDETRAELRLAIGRQRRQDLDLGSDGDDHRLVLRPQLARGTSARRSSAAGSCFAPMLKLRSMASATDSGKSPSANADRVCGWPSSRTVKSARVSPVTGFPA